MTNYQKRRDLKFGLKGELKVQRMLSQFLGMEIIKDPYQYAIFDFYNKDKSILIEVKTRRINRNQYPTLFIDINKIREGQKKLKENPKTNVFFIWNCDDGYKLWELTETNFNKNWIQEGCGRQDRGYDERKALANIPVKDMFDLNEGDTLSSFLEKKQSKDNEIEL
jgi:DNA-dependent RNA polymerase auxiliary subunit epsilon